MRVNVFTAAEDGDEQQELLVLPYGPLGGIPEHLRHMTWRNIATTTVDDRLLPAPPAEVKAEIVSKGFALVRTARGGKY